MRHLFSVSIPSRRRFLAHEKWNGLHLADLLFPSFVWTQGVSMAISFDAARRRGVTGWAMAQRVIVRAIKLYALVCSLGAPERAFLYGASVAS